MTESSDNPYIDEALLHAYATYSPAETSRYLQEHNASKTTQQIANNAALTTQTQFTQLNAPYDVSYHYSDAYSQQEAMIYDEEALGIPIGDGISDKPPLSHSELSSLREGDILYILEESEEKEAVWLSVTFLGLEDDGFRVQSNAEQIFYNTFGDEDMPVIYVHQKDDNECTARECKGNDTNYILPQFDYAIGSNIFVYDDANNFTFYRIESYDASTTKASLLDNAGVMARLYLKYFKHEVVNTEQSKAIPIVDSRAIVRDMNWTWIKRTDGMKLKWMSYKNTLFGCIAVGSKHLYPISLDYKSVNFICNTFHWVRDIATAENVIEEHMKLYFGESHLDSMLRAIGKYSHYKFERHTMSEMLNDETNGMKRLQRLERDIVTALDANVCSISNDELGHFALIVGYCAKASGRSGCGTSYYFKLKRFIARDDYDSEYVLCDLAHQYVVITMDIPPKNKKYSFQHSFSPQILHSIVSDMDSRSICNDCIDLFGLKALQQMMEHEAIDKQSIFALIRLFDSRKTMIELMDWIAAKIKNAFHSQTGSESEWKFAPIHDISDQIEVIENSLKQQVAAIRRQHILFDKYCANYDGKPWPQHKIQCNKQDLKLTMQQIIMHHQIIQNNFKQIKNKLAHYLK